MLIVMYVSDIPPPPPQNMLMTDSVHVAGRLTCNEIVIFAPFSSKIVHIYIIIFFFISVEVNYCNHGSNLRFVLLIKMIHHMISKKRNETPISVNNSDRV